MSSQHNRSAALHVAFAVGDHCVVYCSPKFVSIGFTSVINRSTVFVVCKSPACRPRRATHAHWDVTRKDTVVTILLVFAFLVIALQQMFSFHSSNKGERLRRQTEWLRLWLRLLCHLSDAPLTRFATTPR